MTTLRRIAGGLTFWKLVLAALVIASAYATFLRFTQGLGATTHLSDAFPWGMWIGFDVLVGVGLAAGGFCVAATVHVFHIEDYEPIARPAVLTAFLGYLLVVVALLFDLGQPWRIWHPLVMWNPRSVMFEVAWCVMLYTTVLALEFSPMVLERFGFRRPLKVIRALYVPLVILGVLLSMLHQSSLGTLYVIAAGKLHGLWYSPWLPVYFFLTAVAAGLAMTIVESFLSQRAFGRRLERHLLDGIARVIVVVLAVYGVLKLQDLSARGTLALAFVLTPESVMFWGEIGLGTILPAGLLLSTRVRKSENGLFFGAILAVLGLIVNRLNVSVTGMARASHTNYFPSWTELALTAALVALGFAAFAWAARNLAVFPAHAEHGPKGASHAESALPVANGGVPGWLVATLWVLLAAGGSLYSIAQARDAAAARNVLGAAPVAQTDAAKPQKKNAVTLPEDHSFARGPKSPGDVVFSHDNHLDTNTAVCSECHTTEWSILNVGTPRHGKLTMERMRKGELCGTCHDGEKAFGLTKDEDACSDCHTP